MSQFLRSKYSVEAYDPDDSYGGGWIPDYIPVVGTWGKAKSASEAVIGTDEEWEASEASEASGAAEIPSEKPSSSPPSPPKTRPRSTTPTPSADEAVPLPQKDWFWPVVILGVAGAAGAAIWFWPAPK